MDFKGALEAGYTNEDINTKLGTSGVDYAGAINAGYTNEDIANKLSSYKQSKSEQQMPEPEEPGIMDAIGQGLENTLNFAKYGGAQAGALVNAGLANLNELIGMDSSLFRENQEWYQDQAKKADKGLTESYGEDSLLKMAGQIGYNPTTYIGGAATAPAKIAKGIATATGLESMGEKAVTGDRSGISLKDASDVATDIGIGLAGGKILDKGIESIPGIAKKTGEGLDFLKYKIDENTKTGKFKKAIEENPDNADLAKLKIETVKGKEKVVDDKPAIKAIKQGWSEKAIAPIKNASKVTKKKMYEMLNIQERAGKDAKYALNNRATDIIGDSVQDRISYISKTRKQAGNELNKVAEGLKGQNVQYDDIISNFNTKLSDDIDVIIKTDNGKISIDTTNSAISMDGAGKKLILDTLNKLNKPNLDASDLHKIKKNLNSKLQFSKKKANPISNEADIVLKDLRAQINQRLNDNFEGYSKANMKYGETTEALREIQKAAGTSIDFDKANAGKALGTASRKLLSNSANRVNMSNALKNIDDISKKYGAKFDDDINDLVIFADELERKFGTSAPTSFQGGIEKGVDAAIKAGTQSVASNIGDVVKAAAKKVTGITDENAYKTMRQILMEK